MALLPKFRIYRTRTAAGFQDVLGVGIPHPKASLLCEMKSLSVVWEAKMHCVRFWMKIMTSEVYEGRLLMKAAREAVKCAKGYGSRTWQNV